MHARVLGVDEPLGRGRGRPAALLHLQVFGRPGHKVLSCTIDLPN